MRPVLLTLFLVLLSLGGASVAAAQAPEPAAPEAAQEAAPAGLEPAAAQPGYAAAGSALPQRTPPPATLRAYWHLFGAFAITLLLLFGYALSLGRRFGRLDDEVRRLGRAAE